MHLTFIRFRKICSIVFVRLNTGHSMLIFEQESVVRTQPVLHRLSLRVYFFFFIHKIRLFHLCSLPDKHHRSRTGPYLCVRELIFVYLYNILYTNGCISVADDEYLYNIYVLRTDVTYLRRKRTPRSSNSKVINNNEVFQYLHELTCI